MSCLGKRSKNYGVRSEVGTDKKIAHLTLDTTPFQPLY